MIPSSEVQPSTSGLQNISAPKSDLETPSAGRKRDLCRYYHSKGKTCKLCRIKRTEPSKRAHQFIDLEGFVIPKEFEANPNLTYEGELDKSEALDYTVESIPGK